MSEMDQTSPVRHQESADSQRPIFRVSNLSKKYGENLVLDSISFSLRDGEILGIIGPSGGGKTTLLRCLGLLETFDEGVIEYSGRIALTIRPYGELESRSGSEISLVTTGNLHANYHREVGLVFQEFNLWNWMSVLKNLTLAPIAIKSLDKESASARAFQLCNQLGIGDKLKSKAWALSGGQRQRVAILRALMMNPVVMLLDEITSALDPKLTVDVMQAIQQLQSQGMTMVIVTHHIEFATTLCDRVMFLAEGRAIQLDTPRNLRQAPATVEVQQFLDVLRAAS